EADISGTGSASDSEIASSPAADAGSEAEPDTGADSDTITSPALAWPISARSEAALRDQAARLADYASAHPHADAASIGRILATARTHFSRRAVVLGRTRAELEAGLEAVRTDRAAANVVSGRAVEGMAGCVFVFPGQGSQWAGMGVRLFADSEVFRERMTACAEALAPHVDWSLLDVLHGVPGAPGLDRDDVVQPVLFAMMVSLAGLWESAGVRPSAVVGHSQGEIAAACVSGALSLKQAARLVAVRSKAVASLAGTGAMASAPASAEQVRAWLEPWAGRIGVAAVNGPASTVVSGDADAVREFVEACRERDVRARQIPVAYASHSPHVDRIGDQVAEAAAGIEPHAGQVPFFSTVTGGELGGEALDGGYWFANLREPVLFDDAVRALIGAGHRVFLEVSAHPVLTMSVQERLDADDADAVALGTLRRDEDEQVQFLTAASRLHVRGLPVRWSSLTDPAATADEAERLGLPTYPFERQRYWPQDSGGGAAGRVGAPALGVTAARHALLGAMVPVAEGDTLLFTGRIGARTQPWLADHAVRGTVVLPGTAYLDLALHVGRHAGYGHVEELVVQAPLVLPERGAVQLQAAVTAPDADGRRTFTVHARPDTEAPDQPWTRHAEGRLTADPAPGNPADAWDAQEWPPRDAQPLDVSDLYSTLADHGYDYGPCFQGVRAAWTRGGDVFAEIRLPEGTATGGFGIHPALLDASLHALVLAQDPTAGDGADPGAERLPRLPFCWNEVDLHATDATVLRVAITGATADTCTLTATDPAGAPVVTMEELRLRPMAAGALAAASARDDVFTVGWPRITAPLAAAPVSFALLEAETETE
ncbi:MAG: acyltransferase domain-containing protein, partial [Catenulispora sp.]|nr:acyltransferase domain-containing protein [Catenulispora sp.]